MLAFVSIGSIGLLLSAGPAPPLPPTFAAAQEAYEDGDLPVARQKVEQALGEDPRCVWCHHLLGQILAASGDAQAAAREYREAIRLDPSSSAHHELGDILLRKGDEAAARAEYTADLAANPDCYEARVNLAALALSAGDAALAAREYQASLTYHPDDARAREGLSRATTRLRWRAAFRACPPALALVALCCAAVFTRRRKKA
jgi:tetratricopeptide (TPR) repeat protein